MGNCPSGEQKQAGLCYKPCPDGYDGVGPVCWAKCPAGTTDIGVTCQKPTKTRGVGKIPTDCPAGKQYDAGLCYADCPPNYDGIGPVCWAKCPPGFTDTGVDCLKPSPYGRGWGHVSQSKCENSNDRGARTNGCEKSGLLWYPKCDAKYHAFGCCICSPDCPSGFEDVGITCQKPTKTRGVGSLPICAEGQDKDAGLCYPACPDGYDGIGPVCWGKCSGNTIDTGVDCLKKTTTRGAGKIPSFSVRTWIIIIIIVIVLLVIGFIALKIFLKTETGR